MGYHYLMQLSAMPLLSNYFSTIIEAPVFQPNLITKSLFMEEYRAHQFIGVGIMPVYSFSRKFHAKFEAYGFIPVQEIMRESNNQASRGTYFSTVKTIFNASVNYLTVAGPVGIHAGYISAQDKPWVVQIYFGYLMFNQKSNED